MLLLFSNRRREAEEFQSTSLIEVYQPNQYQYSVEDASLVIPLRVEGLIFEGKVDSGDCQVLEMLIV